MEQELRKQDPKTRVELALAGKALYGDDFNQSEIEEWFRSEQDGYFNLYFAPGGMNGPEGLQMRSGEYEFSAIVERHMFRKLGQRPFDSILGVGCADGGELRPLLKRANNVTILEPGAGFTTSEIDGVPVRYIKPQPSGIMPFPAQTFDLIVCFQTLHHIPNISTVVCEMYRVLKHGSHALLMEPTTSMGDWRYSRIGLTKNERGIPMDIFRRIVRETNFTIAHETPCMFPLTSRFPRTCESPWSSPWLVRLDEIICRLPVWPSRYHATAWWHKLRPKAVALVLVKD